MADSRSAFAVSVVRRPIGWLRGLILPARYGTALVIFLAWPVAVHADDSAYARGMAATCTNCHAATARSPVAIPVIAGRNKSELLQLLSKFKSGARPATVMHQLARGFTDEQLDVLAGYFSTLQPDAGGARN
jgi:cytochrome c553